jgi:thiol-disulfide isomerase/thioredoxin/predicted component of type VI protein secretion system
VLPFRPTHASRIAFLLTLFLSFPALAQESSSSDPVAPPSKNANSRKAAAQDAATENADLQKAISDAGNDRAAMVRNLDAFLNKYPESSQRPQIYRAIVESSLQLRDFPRATEYAERIVALNPDDTSMTVLSIQLLDHYGSADGWRRAVSYCTRVVDRLEHAALADKPLRVSADEWQTSQKRDISSLLVVRGRLEQKMNDLSSAQKDFAASYAALPNGAAAESLGEIAELKKDLNDALRQYTRAFSLDDRGEGVSSRRELRKKIGNVWRLAHGSEDGLGTYLLQAFDETAAAIILPKTIPNKGLKEPYEFTLRKAPEGTPFPLADSRGKVVVLNFWATWCGPCRELEPHFEKVATRFSGEKDVLFYGLNCDEDESLVAPYLAEERPKTTILFADGLDLLLSVNSFPTTVILDRAGKVAYRSDGFDPDDIEKVLSEAITRVAHPEENPASATASAGP